MLVVLALFLQKSYYLYKDEETIVQLATILKKSFTGKDYSNDEFLFINTSYDNQLINIYDETGFFPLGNRPITDRQKLTQLFKSIGEDPNYRFVICDIFFESPTKHDSALQKSALKLPDFYVSYLMTDSGTVYEPVIDLPGAIAYIDILDDVFTKFKMAWGPDKLSLPLKIHLDESNTEFEYGWIHKLDNGYVIDPFFLDLRINNYDLFEKEEYPLINLGEFLLLGKENIHELTKNRIIVIGDFIFSDNLETYIGEISGPLILLNAFLALENRDMVISWPFILYLIFCFYLVTLIIYNPDDFFEKFIRNNLKFTGLASNLTKGFIVVLLLSIISIFSYFIFRLHINILVISLYVYALDYGVMVMDKKRKDKKNETSHDAVDKN